MTDLSVPVDVLRQAGQQADEWTAKTPGVIVDVSLCTDGLVLRIDEVRGPEGARFHLRRRLAYAELGALREPGDAVRGWMGHAWTKFNRDRGCAG